MIITSLRLRNFRSYTDSSFEFADGVNIIVGPNGSGKTNLLEAILFLACGKSYRGRDGNLIKQKKHWARLDATDERDHSRSVKLKNGELMIGKEFLIDNVPKKRLGAQTILPVVLFEPNHLLMISSDPGLRREYLDELTAKLSVTAAADQRAYLRVLAQRNALLKQQAGSDRFFAWDVQLAELADNIVKQRHEAIKILNKKLLKTYKELGGRAKSLKVVYETKFAVERYGEQLMKYLHNELALDMARGFTGRGPHREDIRFLFDGVDARTKASRGEMRTLLLALKIIEIQMTDNQHQPILLLDDVFSELDGHRRKALAERLSGYQTFITTTDADIVVEHFLNRAKIIPLS